MSQPSPLLPLYRGYRFPPEIISHCVWLYYRFGVSLRDVSELVLARGIEVSFEAIRHCQVEVPPSKETQHAEFATRLGLNIWGCGQPSFPQLDNASL
jgi:transposase-like protein